MPDDDFLSEIRITDDFDPITALPTEAIATILNNLNSEDLAKLGRTSTKFVNLRPAGGLTMTEARHMIVGHSNLEPVSMSIEEISNYRTSLADKSRQLENLQQFQNFKVHKKAISGIQQQLAVVRRDAGRWIYQKQNGELGGKKGANLSLF